MKNSDSISNNLHNILLRENLKLLNHGPLTGGDINDVFLLETNQGNYVIKTNDPNRFPKMFEAEAKGLRLLKNTQSFRIPEVIAFGENENYSYLLMEYIAVGSKQTDFWETFGLRLVELHQNTSKDFGLDHDNYIGSLPQKNDGNYTLAADFYIEKRLLPQLELAAKKGFSFQSLDSFYKNIRQEIPDEPPALIHGDLWNGNYLTDQNGHPCLIDPAVGFASREMDLAMMQLFGGFPKKVFDSYNNNFPIQPGWKTRTDLWQLYYLLVHLNLFGSGYYNSVKTILKKYS